MLFTTTDDERECGVSVGIICHWGKFTERPVMFITKKIQKRTLCVFVCYQLISVYVLAMISGYDKSLWHNKSSGGNIEHRILPAGFRHFNLFS